MPLALLTLLVRRKLGHSAFFRQVRPGSHGQPFEVVKLRSMTDARGPGVKGWAQVNGHNVLGKRWASAMAKNCTKPGGERVAAED